MSAAFSTNPVSRSLRSVIRDGATLHEMTLECGLDAPPSEVWSALTQPQRLARWFLPITGELREGGSYQFQGNAGGRILQRVAPSLLEATWEFGGTVGWVTLHIAARSQGAHLSFVHLGPVDPAFFQQYGPGAMGIGWDLSVAGLVQHLAAPQDTVDQEAWLASGPGQALLRESADAWEQASVSMGTDPDKAARASRASFAFFGGRVSGTEA